MDYGTSGSCCDLFFQAPEDIQYIGYHIYVSARYGLVSACCNGILSFCKYARLVFKILRMNTRLQTVLKHGNSTIQTKTISICLSVHLPSFLKFRLQSKRGGKRAATETARNLTWIQENCAEDEWNKRHLCDFFFYLWEKMRFKNPAWFSDGDEICWGR